jgi:hypothetical protein
MFQKYVCGLMVLLLTCGQSSARGSYRTEDRYNPQHIDSLPPEVRNAIYRRCAVPKALHPFASYSDNKRIVLHFEHFVCDGDGTYCTAAGCLHQVYILRSGRYQLLRSYYGLLGD